MAELLTLTTIPQVKFEWFARFSRVPPATSLDLRYTKVTDEQTRKHHARSMVKYLNTGKQSNVPDFYQQNKTRRSIASDTESVSSAKTAILRTSTETRDHSTGSVDKDHYFKNYPGDRALVTVVKYQKNDGDIDHKSNWSEVRYTIPTPDLAVDDNSHNTNLATGNATRASEVGKVNEKSNKSDFPEASTSHKAKDDTNNNILLCSNFAPSFDNIFKKYAMKPPIIITRNTRHGGDRKITAYRPCTSLDKFRRNWLSATERTQPHCPDVNEASNIWAEVDKIIENSKYRRQRIYEHFHEKPLTAHTSERKRCNQDRLAIELRPCFKNIDATVCIDNSKTKVEPESDKPDIGNISLSKQEDRSRYDWMAEAADIGNISLSKQEGGSRYDWMAETADIGNISLSKQESGSRYDWMAEAAGCNDHSNGKTAFGEENGLNKHTASGRQSYATGQNAGVVWISPETVLDGIPSQNHRYNLNGLRNCEEQNSWSLERVCKGKGATMSTTTLPRITPMSTPLPTGITQPPPRSHSSASMYVPYPPKELSSSFDYLRIPQRVNPLAPPPPRRRINWSWETTDQHYENEKRSLLMQKREHTRYHSAWSKAFYGAPAEKEAYRRHFREVLKQQMADKTLMEKEAFKQKTKEVEQAISYDRECRMNDAKEYFRKHAYLMQYRDGNKQQMEEKWAHTRYNRELEDRIDRERLRYNPINWSCTLK